MEITDRLEDVFRLKETQKKALARLKLETVEDLLFYFPLRYSHVSTVKQIASLAPGDLVTVYGKIDKLKTKKGYRSKVPMAEGVLIDDSGKIPVVWFNQAFIAKTLSNGERVQLTGKVTEGRRGLYLSNPECTKKKTLPIDSHDSLFQGGIGGEQFPVYRESRGITSRWIFHTVLKILAGDTLVHLTDYLPETVRKRYHLPSLQTALVWIHTPRQERDAIAARKRFAFEEIFCIQLSRARQRYTLSQQPSYQISITDDSMQEFTSRLPFSLTAAQQRAIDDIVVDITSPGPMARLLEGDVGSGKTAVAAAITHAIVTNRPAAQQFGHLQVAYMAPTEILAIQHFESFITYFKNTGIQIGLLTGSGCRKFPSKVSGETWTSISRRQLLSWVANGEIPILVGTHALIQKTITFEHLALVIIDEQHRFGTNQRMLLTQKGSTIPHLLSMTATPIPRTLALTIYGDLDLTLIDTLPHGRKQAKTVVVDPENRETTYQHVIEELSLGRQAYIICPRIDDPDPEKEQQLQQRSVRSETQRLKRGPLSSYSIAGLHSKMKKEKKEAVMKRFAQGELDVLVATSVVEVGVNVPNATVMIIEGAERFGLSQLHQLRGRIMRSTHQAYCFLFTETKNEKTHQRLKALMKAKNGFELAERDLQLRGAGELAGNKQWGVSDLGMEAIKNLDMVEAARKEAAALIDEDPALNLYPHLRNRITNERYNIHLE